ncbi:MAG: sugar ABC transporter permease, partial [Mycetocola sp.]
MTLTATAEQSPVVETFPPPRKKPKQLWASRGLLWPAVLVLIALTQIPFVVTIFYSLQSWNLLKPGARAFAGFDNYVTVLTNGSFLESLWSTVLITGSTVVLATVAGMGFALLLDRPFRGRALARTLMITPFLIMPAAAALLWKWSMLDANSGLINLALGAIGLPPVEWSTDAPVASIVIVLAWQYTPIFALIFLAGLQSQSRETLEAASV